MKKLVSVLLCVMLALGVCSVGMAEAAKEPVTLSLWVWDDAQVPATQAMVDAFMEKYPWITVEITSIAGVTDYNIKIQSVIGTEAAPSVFWLNFNLGRDYIPMGFVQDLTQFIEADETFDLSTLNAGITEAYTVDGHCYAVPKDTDGYAVFYNKALFDAAGVPYPQSDWTLEEFAETAKLLTTDTVKGWTNANSDRVWYSLIMGNGGEIYTEDGMAAAVNSPQAIETSQILMDLMNNGYAFNGTQLAEVSVMASFSSQLAAMTIEGSWMISQYAEAFGENLGIVEIPSGAVGKASAGHGIGYATTTSNPHMEETWLLLSYLGSEEAQAMQVEVVIPAANAAAGIWEQVYPEYNLKAFVNALGYSRPIPLAAKNPTMARNAFKEVVANILAGMYPDAAAAMADAEVLINDAINY